MQRSDMTLAHVWQCGLHVAVSGVKAASANRYRALDPRFTGIKLNCFGQGGLLLHSSRSPVLQHRRLHMAAQITATNGSGASPPAAPIALRVIDEALHVEAERSYLAYAMSVIVGRALPDVKDGLKPVHRRILYAMHDLGLHHNKPFRKCARIVGETLGKYHPHGDQSVYDALVRLAQDFSMRVPLIDGHGNFGSVDNDPAAAMRYTECRLQHFSSATFLADLDADTVDFTPNFDASQDEPAVLPARVPHLLVNGAAGIAVGIATKIPPHNLREVVAGLKALIRDPDISITQLMQHIPGPDFPTGGQILATDAIRTAYHDGRGSIPMRGKVIIEGDAKGDSNGNGSEGTAVAKAGKAGRGKTQRKRSGEGKPAVVITELPYQINKATFVETVAKLVNGGEITGVSDVRDESDRDGMRVVVELRRGANAEVVVNNLYKQTSLQTTFPCNMVALVEKTPQTLNLKQFLEHFLAFRCDVVERRARFNLGKAEKRQHLVAGFLAALTDLDQIVKLIRAADDGAAASECLQQQFRLSKEQAEGVLNMSLRRLTSLEANRLQEESQQLNSRIQELSGLLQHREQVLAIIESEADEIAAKFGSPRRTVMSAEANSSMSVEDIIPNSQSLVVFSRKGYIKRIPADTFSLQHRGGRGMQGAKLKGDDSVEDIVQCMDHDSVLFFTSDGVVRSLKAHQIPQASRTAIGTAITQVLPIKKTDRVAAMLPVEEYKTGAYLLMATVNGLIKKTPLSQFQDVRANGLIAMKLKEGDQLLWVGQCQEDSSALLASSAGKALHLATTDKELRPLGRPARGLRGMQLKRNETLVGMSILSASATSAAAAEGAASPTVLLVTAQGLGKRVPVEAFPLQRRAGMGNIAIKCNPGDRLVALHVVDHGEGSETDVLLGSEQGLMTRIALDKIALHKGRSGKGMRLMKLKDGDSLQTVTPILATSAQL
ncbi:hypothetical protein ABBQ38_002033 [Trebouxia sp. C0009 RCD-2024]